MPKSKTAEIIPFPPRTVTTQTEPSAQPRDETPDGGQSPAEARLTRALNGLNNAVIAQRAAMAAWRSALGDLRTVTSRLGASLRSYNDSLNHLDARVTTLRNEAIKHEAL